MKIDSQLQTVVKKRMRRRGLRERDIDFFLGAWQQLESGDAERKLDWGQVQPVGEQQVSKQLQDSHEMERLQALGLDNLHRCAIVKLNGGRSTTMGGLYPKCMVPAKDGKSFLDIVIGQVTAANDHYETEMPLVLMNSFFTDHVTDKLIGRTPLIIMNFIQNEYPRIRKSDLRPLDTGTDDDWCPAGHGDFYASLDGTGMLDDLLSLGIRYVFISNIDNLAAEISPAILGALIDGRHDFMMEVIRKSPLDVKGGAPVMIDGRLALAEVAQVPQECLHDFQDIEKFQYFNTNNLWVDLYAVKAKLAGKGMSLPLIGNSKKVAGVEVVQIETAMGAALGCFDNPGLLEVPRDRFAPVKKLADLLLLRSDIYLLDEKFRLSLNPQRPPHLAPLPLVEFHSGFPAGGELENGFSDSDGVSLLKTEFLSIGGDIFFTGKLAFVGRVVVENPGADRHVLDQDGLLALQTERAVLSPA